MRHLASITLRAAALSLATAVVLAGCTPAPEPAEEVPHDAATGRSLDDARSAIEDIPGITVTRFVGGVTPNVKGNTGYDIVLHIDPGYSVEAGDLVVDYIVRQVWSIGEGYMPNTQIALTVVTADGEPYFDLNAAGVGSAWLPPEEAEPSQRNIVIISLDDDDPEGKRNLSLLAQEGSWPGPAPKPLPNTVTVPRS